ncbi:terminal uridylyltransferase 7 isoform X50 [Hippocampus zosterae]|uniref:terminal uridylyltransferase 7 isoform X1 n=1 Tax=Hippocampus zosterae TaxID=109293 RepID=UPI00223E00FC|nr:terminal uridylyltransferase 7 isoform X1 [Hippocampus zosterae]XP_051923085.1 terminal uridylyltransferase 7 isoform X2 [Hippocampus zosterae]XP_051923086.1 terminal uridylyltransferase 7 isoform X3 [Hippocampus zosterae]XP_051923087.1 terminal uridylyltransferase 7 isoform X4 [Hippocampus zosterae]XP_051923088.1 terminal uridylyltransferase 7 isoform X5 [Hippocampus zosterae]XP_051923089.1 terminal uridylyltransferase 7 isoform X6 [Hippocampus zosterae]XP_051923090.1 terminal uridylyltra
MENSDRHNWTRSGSWGAAADGWRSQDQSRGQTFRTDGGQQGKRNQGAPYWSSPKRGGFGPLGYSPGAFRGGHSPLQRDDLHRFWSPENSGGTREESWREHLQQQWGKSFRDGGPHEDRDMWRRDTTDGNVLNAGKRRRPRNKRRNFAEEDRELANEESSLSAKDLQVLRQAEMRLSKDDIHCLKKKSNSKPNALYTCALCDVLLDSVSDANRHIRDKRHKRRLREKKEHAMLTEILPPGPEHVHALTAALEAVVREHGMDDCDVEGRRCVVSLMQDLLLSVLPEIRLRLYGSSCTKFGFKDSDVNIDIQYPPHMHQPDVLMSVKECLTVSPLFVDLEADFHACVPVVICKEKKSGLLCKVSAGNENAFQTTSYLATLANQEHLLPPLVLGLRRWAKICQIDRADEGGLPPYVFALMVIYFLQQRKEPLLPSYLNQAIKTFSLSKLSDFNFTCVEDGHLHWTCTSSAKDAPQPPEGSSMKGKVPLVFQNPHPPVEIGFLWVEMLRFYSLEFNMADNVVSVRTGAVLSRELKDWPKKRIAVEDPFAVKRNVARSVNSQQMYDYILHCLKTTYRYFALPLNTPAANHKMAARSAKDSCEGKELSQLSIGSQSQREENGPEDSDCIIEEEDEIEEGSDSEGEKEKADLGKSSFSEEEEDEDAEARGRRHLDSFTTEDEEIFPVDEISGEELLSDEEPPDLDTPGSNDDEEEEELAPAVASHPRLPDTVENELPENKHHMPTAKSYQFSKHAFTRGKSHTVVCSLCKRDGHLKKDCPEDFKKVELRPLPPMTPDFLNVLDQVCEQCFVDFAPDDLEMAVRERILQDLETFVRRQFPGARLQLFGSSKNGFGFRQSDLDICMVREGQDNIDDVDCINIIERLAKLLRKHPDLRNILPITTAKVPIVKFYHVRTGLEGDISLYNRLALHNTRLLALYAAIDRRVKILCYVMKVFAKICDIGDASRGSLSSYAYTLMVLFFLQQRDPPLIPVLQELYDGDNKPEVIADGWNVYFFDDLKTLPSRWPQYGTNTETVGELWLGLLRFYTEDFDFKEHVVCTRQKARLTTFNKQWTSKYIVIEDPFDLSHNLGAGLSRKMTNFIMKAFINGRTVFGTPVTAFPPEYPRQMEYFFDPQVLTEGEVAPNDRCCRICGKIGHFMKDCPMRRKSRHRHDSERRPDGMRERVDTGEDLPSRHKSEHWRWRDAAEPRCCFLCGSSAHIKKDCQLYRGNTKMENFPSPSAGLVRNFREKQNSPLNDENKRHQHVTLSPQAGSLATRSLGRASHRKSPVE